GVGVPAVVLDLLDEALVLQLRQRRVDGPRAGLPIAERPLGDLLHELVAVHRGSSEQVQDGVAHVPPAGPPGAALLAPAAVLLPVAAEAGAAQIDTGPAPGAERSLRTEDAAGAHRSPRTERALGAEELLGVEAPTSLCHGSIVGPRCRHVNVISITDQVLVGPTGYLCGRSHIHPGG